MNKLIKWPHFLLIVLILPSFLAAQKCKFDVDKIDKFTKQHKLEKEIKVNGAGFTGDSYLSLNFCNYDSVHFIRIMWARKESVVVGTTDRMIFLFENGETASLNPYQIYSSDYRASTKQSVLRATYKFKDSNDINKFINFKVTSIRISYNQVYKDTEIKGKFQDDITRAATCVFSAY